MSPELIAGCDGLFVCGGRFTERSFAGAPSERLLCLARWGVGYDRIDVPACTAAGVALTITPEGVRRPVAVTELGLILALALKLPLKDRLVREGRAGEKIYHFGIGLTGRTLGSLGVGNIGSELFRIAAPLEMRAIAHDPYARPEQAAALGVELVPMERLLAESDFLCVNTPLTPETRGIIDEAVLARMKPTAYLVNTARGEIVRTDALTRALQEGRLAGAGLDVTDPEPLPPDHPLCRPNWSTATFWTTLASARSWSCGGSEYARKQSQSKTEVRRRVVRDDRVGVCDAGAGNGAGGGGRRVLRLRHGAQRAVTRNDQGARSLVPEHVRGTAGAGAGP
jgi:phosphoglycerate dehydrogenase-like enzyme